MKFTILQKKLKQGLNFVEKIAAKSPTLPILNNVLIETEENFVRLSATDLEMGINYWLLSKVERKGKTVVPVQIFSNLISYLTLPSLVIEEKQNNLFIRAEKTETKIKTLNADDFPIIPKTEQPEKIVLSSKLFCQGLAQIIGIASLSTIRPEISGVYLNFEKKQLIMAATDSFRLAEKRIKFKTPLNLAENFSLILPQKSASQVISLFGEKEGDLSIYLSNNLIMFESLMTETSHPELQFVSKLIEGEYPKYEEIIPHQFKTESVAEKNEFVNQVKTAGLLAGRINEVKLKFDPANKQIHIFCENPELGEHRSVLPAKINGKEAEISFNFKFLLDGLLSINASEINLCLSKEKEDEKESEEGPGLLKPVGDDSYLYVVMPIQSS